MDDVAIKGFMARNELFIIMCMVGAAFTVLLLAMLMPANGVFFGVNVSYWSRLLSFVAGVLAGEAFILLRIMFARGRSL